MLYPLSYGSNFVWSRSDLTTARLARILTAILRDACQWSRPGMFAAQRLSAAR